LTFEQLETMDLPLARAVAPGQRQAGRDGGQSVLETLGKARQRGKPTSGGLGHPRRERRPSALAHQGEKRLTARLRWGEGALAQDKLCNVELGLGGALRFRTHPGKRDRAG
jgi:hypothetical protein